MHCMYICCAHDITNFPLRMFKFSWDRSSGNDRFSTRRRVELIKCMHNEQGTAQCCYASCAYHPFTHSSLISPSLHTIVIRWPWYRNINLLQPLVPWLDHLSFIRHSSSVPNTTCTVNRDMVSLTLTQLGIQIHLSICALRGSPMVGI